MKLSPMGLSLGALSLCLGVATTVEAGLTVTEYQHGVSTYNYTDYRVYEPFTPVEQYLTFDDDIKNYSVYNANGIANSGSHSDTASSGVQNEGQSSITSSGSATGSSNYALSGDVLTLSSTFDLSTHSTQTVDPGPDGSPAEGIEATSEFSTSLYYYVPLNMQYDVVTAYNATYTGPQSNFPSNKLNFGNGYAGGFFYVTGTQTKSGSSTRTVGPGGQFAALNADTHADLYLPGSVNTSLTGSMSITVNNGRALGSTITANTSNASAAANGGAVDEGGVTGIFDKVNIAGTFSVNYRDAQELQTNTLEDLGYVPLNSFSLADGENAIVWDVNFSGTFEDQVTLYFAYNTADFAGLPKLFHYTSQGWVLEQFEFFAAGVIKVTVDEFSPFLFTDAEDAVIPEPTTLALLAVGAFVATVRRRRSPLAS